MKTCSLCGLTLPSTEFNRDKNKKDGLYTRCKSCVRLYYETQVRTNPERMKEQRRRSKEWRTDNPERSSRGIRCATLRKKYGISADEFDNLFIQQGKVCAICGDTNSKGNGSMHVDHDHKTGAIRGILCQACNVTLGKMKDNPELLRKAADYLEKLS